MRSKLLAYFFLALILVTPCTAISCGDKFLLRPADREHALEADFARSVFSFKGGTAYYIGGSPGYLITNKHVFDDSPDMEKEVCSDFYSGERLCMEVEDSAPQFPGEDLVLLKLKSKAKQLEDLRPFGLAVSNITAYSDPIISSVWIMGYPVPGNAALRKWEVNSGRITNTRLQDKNSFSYEVGSFEGFNTTEYYEIAAPQEPGASGAPVINRYGMVVATAFAGWKNNKAIAIPHNQRFFNWVVKNTTPSIEHSRIIKIVDTSIKTGANVKDIRKILLPLLDVRGRPMAGLDLLHLIQSLKKDESILNALGTCPLNETHQSLVNIASILDDPDEARVAIENTAKWAGEQIIKVEAPEFKASYATIAKEFNLKAFESQAAKLVGEGVISVGNIATTQNRFPATYTGDLGSHYSYQIDFSGKRAVDIYLYLAEKQDQLKRPEYETMTSYLEKVKQFSIHAYNAVPMGDNKKRHLEEILNIANVERHGKVRAGVDPSAFHDITLITAGDSLISTLPSLFENEGGNWAYIWDQQEQNPQITIPVNSNPVFSPKEIERAQKVGEFKVQVLDLPDYKQKPS